MRALAFVLVSSLAFAGSYNVIYYNGVKFDDRYGAPKRFTGEKSYRDGETNRLVSRAQYVDGIEEGAFSTYDRDGKLEDEGTNHRGKRNGPFKRYSHGQLRMEWAYVDGEIEGVQKEYRDGKLDRLYQVLPGQHGVPTNEMHFNAQGQLTLLECGPQPIGKQDAEWCGMNGKQSTVTIYTADGKQRAIEQYLWGKQHGTWRRFDRNGAVTEEVKYENGKRVGETQNDHGVALYTSNCDAKRSGCTETEMFPGGKETKVVTTWKGGKLASRVERYQNGKIREEITVDKERFTITRNDDEARPISKGTYIQASTWSWQPYVVDGTVEYFENGELWRREKCVAGSREGTSQTFWRVDAHRIREDSEYVEDRLVSQKIWVDDKLAVELSYMPDGSLKQRRVLSLPKGLDI